MTNKQFKSVPEKLTIVVNDRVVLIDSQDLNKLKQTPATAFVWPQWPIWITWNWISSITLISGTHAPWTLDTYRVNYTNWTHYDYQVYNGANFSPWSVPDSTELVKWIWYLASTWDVTTWTNDSKFMTPLKFRTYFDSKVTTSSIYNGTFYWTTYTAYNSWSLWYINNSYYNAVNYATAKQITANYNWRFTISANLNAESGNSNQVSARLYLNWSLLEQKDWTYTTSWTFNTSFTNFLINSWDILRLDVKVIQSQFPWNNERVWVSSFNCKYDLITTQTLFS